MPTSPPSDTLADTSGSIESTHTGGLLETSISRSVSQPVSSQAAQPQLLAPRPAASSTLLPYFPLQTPPRTVTSRVSRLPVAVQEPVAAPAAATPKRQTPRSERVEVPVPSVVRARERATQAVNKPLVLRVQSLTKSYGRLLAAADVSFEVHAGSLTGVVGPNGAGKTTVLSMVSGLNRPSFGRVLVHDIDVWRNGPAAKRVIGSLPDRLRLFDRLTGSQLLYYAGILQGLNRHTATTRTVELAAAFGLDAALTRPVADYSAGMQKKIGLACAMIHAPELLVLDEPYETIDPVSAANVTDILEKYVAAGGSVIMSSHSLDLIQRICDHAVVIVNGSVVAQGTVDAVRDGVSLEERFRHLTGAAARTDGEPEKGLGWLHGSSVSE